MIFRKVWTPIAVFLAGIAPLSADDESAFERIWQHTELYESETNPVFQKLVLSGRAQADAAFFQGGGDRYERLQWRRFRFGAKGYLFQDFVVHGEADFDLNDVGEDILEDVFNRFTDLYVGWSPNDAFSIKVGKQSAPFTLDGATSSKKLITLERSTVAANLWFPVEYFTGAAGMGEVGNWSYHAGIYSAEGDDVFGNFESGYFGLFSLGYDLAEQTQMDDASIRLDYVFNDPDYSGEVASLDLRHVASLSAKIQKDRLGLWSDFSAGKGIGEQGDLFGLQVMPFYDITDDWQLVFRYSFVTGSEENSVALNRYESRLEPDFSDEAHEFYLGLNWYLFGHKLKWQNGVEFTHARDGADDGGAYNGWGITSGIRLSW